MCKLGCVYGEDELEAAMILNIPQVEEQCSQAVVGKGLFCNVLRNCGLLRPSKSVEPENQIPSKIFSPSLDLIQCGFLCAIASIPVLISSVSAMTVIQDDCIGFDIWPTGMQ